MCLSTNCFFAFTVFKLFVFTVSFPIPSQVLGIEPYNTLEKRMRGSYTLKRTLV